LSSKNTITEAQTTLARATSALSLLKGVAPEILGETGTDLSAYQQEVTQLQTKVEALTQHLAALATLLPEVTQEARQIKRRNKQSTLMLRQLIKGKPVRRSKRTVAVTPAEEEAVAAPAPTPPAPPSTKTRNRAAKRA